MTTAGILISTDTQLSRDTKLSPVLPSAVGYDLRRPRGGRPRWLPTEGLS